jgi:hypothetical protein
MAIGIADTLLNLVAIALLEHTKELYENVPNRTEIKSRVKNNNENKEYFEDLTF